MDTNNPQAPAFGRRAWDHDESGPSIQELLERKMHRDHISKRQGAGGAVAYVESWKAIELANAVFGFNGWSSTIVDIAADFVEPENGKWKVGVTAIVKVMLKDGAFHEDIGYGIQENKSKGLAIENAKKEAVSDARKRALRVFGNQLGNSVYDRVWINQETKGATKSTTVAQPPITYAGLRKQFVSTDSQHPDLSNDPLLQDHLDEGSTGGGLKKSPISSTVQTPNSIGCETPSSAVIGSSAMSSNPPASSFASNTSSVQTPSRFGVGSTLNTSPSSGIQSNAARTPTGISGFSSSPTSSSTASSSVTISPHISNYHQDQPQQPLQQPQFAFDSKSFAMNFDQQDDTYFDAMLDSVEMTRQANFKSM